MNRDWAHGETVVWMGKIDGKWFCLPRAGPVAITGYLAV